MMICHDLHQQYPRLVRRICFLLLAVSHCTAGVNLSLGWDSEWHLFFSDVILGQTARTWLERGGEYLLSSVQLPLVIHSQPRTVIHLGLLVQ